MLKKLTIPLSSRGIRLNATVGRKLSCALISAAFLLLSTQSSYANDTPGPFSDQQIKVAYLYYFSKFTRWPEHTVSKDVSSFDICYWGIGSVANLIHSLNHKNVHGLPLNIRRVDSAQQAKPCHVLYLGSSNLAQTLEFTTKLQHLPLLSVSDVRGFARSGGMIEFVRTGDKLRFGINLDNVDAAGLQIDPHLLKLAHIERNGK